MINLEWIRTFSAIFECGNITEASYKLHMTQPGVSKHLLALENHIGKKLFDRTTRKIVPTEYGKFYYNQISIPLKQLEKIEHFGKKNVKKKRTAIVIGCTTDFFKNELLDIIYQFDMYINTCFGSQKELAQSLEDNKIQLLVGVEKYTHFPHQFTPLRQDNLVLVVSKKISIPEEVKKDKKELVKWLRKQVWFAYDNELEHINKFWTSTFNLSSQLIAQYILSSYRDMVEALKNTKGVGILPQSICTEALREGTVQDLLPTNKKVAIELFYSNKAYYENSDEIIEFKEKMKNKKSVALHSF